MQILLLVALSNLRPSPSEFDRLAEGFRNPPMESRMRMFWRIFGPAWEPAEIDYQLNLMKSAGIGGVVAFFFYPVALDDPSKGIKNERFLSPQFLKTLGYASHKAKELGLRFGVSGGTGWPFGGPTVSIADAAKRIRREIIKPDSDGSYRLPALREGESLIAAFPSTSQPRTVFISSPTRMQVKRSALGGEGYVIDHYDRAVLERYLNAFVLPMVQVGGIDSIFCDSLEVYNSNWTPALPVEFRRRRGYDLIPQLEKLFDGDPDIRFDFWRTLAELHEERFTKPLAEWCHRHGVKLEMEAYGTPPDPLTSARYIDMPCGEQYEWKGFSFSRWAASGAHLAGKRVISAEAWTWLGIPNRLADSLSDFKLASDMHFLAGINELIGVDCPYSPRSVGAPGWLPYYGPVMNQNNPQWPYFHSFVDYVNRCQWMLRQGKPVADVAVYLPVEDKLATGPLEQMPLDFLIRDHFVSGKLTGEFSLENARLHDSALLRSLLNWGFNFDGVDFWSINRFAKIDNGRLCIGDGRYRVIILPDLSGIDLDACRKIEQFCLSGGYVIATGKHPPDRAYGVGRSFESREVHALFDRMFASRDGDYGKGHAFFIQGTDEAAAKSVIGALYEVEPLIDMEFIDEHGADDDLKLACVHRRSALHDIYFIANPAEHAVKVQFFAPIHSRPVSSWNPAEGKINSLAAADDKLTINAGTLTDAVLLPPRGSVFITFGAAPNARMPGPWVPGHRFEQPIVHWESRSIDGPWMLEFDGRNPPVKRMVENLGSWTALSDARHFSGQATYSTTFEFSGRLPIHALLRLGTVHEAAEVRLNGRSAGIAWFPPYEVDVTGILRQGANRLEITVGNLPVNQYIGLPQEDLRAVRAAYGNRFPDPEEKSIMKEPAPSGLLGPVTLIYREPLPTSSRRSGIQTGPPLKGRASVRALRASALSR